MAIDKRLFFAFSIHTPWPENLPPGRIIEENNRHMTFVFLGNQNPETLLNQIDDLPHPSFSIGKTGKFSECCFLPKKEANTASWEGNWFNNGSQVESYHNKLVQALMSQGYSLNRRSDTFFPHVTIARRPFNKEEWLEAFTQLPFYLKEFHLLESLGHSQYRSLWNVPFLHPFDEFEHTADIAFTIRGETLTELYANAATALCFEYPAMTSFVNIVKKPQSLEELIQLLNHHLFEIDCQIGVPFKAVSYSGKMKETNARFYEWEMIVDV